MNDTGGGALILGEYLHVLGREKVGEGDLARLACTVSASTTNFSIRDCLLAKSSAPLPIIGGGSTAELLPRSEAGPLEEVGGDLVTWREGYTGWGGQEATELTALADLLREVGGA